MLFGTKTYGKSLLIAVVQYVAVQYMVVQYLAVQYVAVQYVSVNCGTTFRLEETTTQLN